MKLLGAEVEVLLVLLLNQRTFYSPKTRADIHTKTFSVSLSTFRCCLVLVSCQAKCYTELAHFNCRTKSDTLLRLHNVKV